MVFTKVQRSLLETQQIGTIQRNVSLKNTKNQYDDDFCIF